MKKPHTHFTPGKKVRVKLKHGAVYIGAFVSRTDRFVEIRDDVGLTRFPTKSIKSIGFWKPNPDA